MTSLANSEYNFFAICDGHGLNGHHVSNLAKT